jgi:hypothetical protein
MLARGFPETTVKLRGLPCFTDFTGDEQWFWAYACAAKNSGVIKGNPDGSFAGTRNVTLAEALAMAVRAWKVPEPQYFRQPDHWYDPYMDAASSNTDFFSDYPFEPGRTLTRSDAAFLIDAFLSMGVTCGTHSAGETYKVDCNTCTCTAQGEACTKMACIHSSSSSSEKTCMSTSQCGAGEICTTEDGDCRSICPVNDPKCMAPAVCMGVCRAR